MNPLGFTDSALGSYFWNSGSLGSRLTMATRWTTFPAASLRRMWPWPTFEILSPTKKFSSLMGLWTITLLALWEKDKARATQVKTMSVRALLAAMADVGDIVEEAGVHRAQSARRMKMTFEARCWPKRKGDPYHVKLKTLLDVLGKGTLVLRGILCPSTSQTGGSFGQWTHFNRSWFKQTDKLVRVLCSWNLV